MEFKKTGTSKIDPEQRELIERAQTRARQKKRLYLHFILFLIGSVLLILLNVIFNFGEDIKPLGIEWFVWIIGIWGLVFLLHMFNVFVTNKFFGKDWENRQVEKLVEKQRVKIENLQKKVEKDHPAPVPKSLQPPDEPTNSGSSINS